MNGLIYTAVTQEVTVSAAQDLWEGLLASDHIIIPLSLRFAQRSDVGDAEEEILPISIRRITGAPTSGSGGSTPTARPHQTHFPSSAVVWEANNTTQLTGGTNVILGSFNINVRQPEIIIPLVEERWYFSPVQRILVELEQAPGDPLTWMQTLTYMEIGG